MPFPGDVLALLSPLQDLKPGFYVVHHISDGWATLGILLDDERNERLVETATRVWLPAELLAFLMPVGIRLSTAD